MLLGFTWFYWDFTGFYLTWPRFDQFHRVLPSFTGFHWVLLGFTGFYRVPVGDLWTRRFSLPNRRFGYRPTPSCWAAEAHFVIYRRRCRCRCRCRWGVGVCIFHFDVARGREGGWAFGADACADLWASRRRVGLSLRSPSHLWTRCWNSLSSMSIWRPPSPRRFCWPFSRRVGLGVSRFAALRYLWSIASLFHMSVGFS